MSEQLYVVIAVTATFAAVVFAGSLVVTGSLSRRASSVLEQHLESAGITVAPGRGDGSFGDRVLAPMGRWITSTIARVMPSGIRNGVARRLSLAGDPKGWTPELFLLVEFLGVLAGGALGYWFGVRNGPHVLGMLWVPLLAYVAYLMPSSWLGGRATRRQEAIRRDLADTIDLLTISVEAGLAFDAALLHTRRSMRGPLAEEIGRMLHEMQLGVSRPDAMRHLAERNDVAELKSFVLAMVQADVFGVSIANVLRSQAQELRTKRRQRAEEKAMKTPVKLLFPMILCVLPSLLVLVVGPGVIRIAHTFNSGP